MVLKLIHNLVPPRQGCNGERAPLLTALFSLSWLQLAQLFSGWLAQTCDSMDLSNTAMNANRLKKQFHQDTDTVLIIVGSLNILFRIFGGVLFGMLSDRFGRKWPLVVPLLFCSLLQIGTAFTQTIEQFLILRSLSGFAMGSVWGIAVSNALENLPVETRGLASGILGQGYTAGYLVSIVMNTYFVTDDRHTWRMLFWIDSGITAFTAIVRAAIPESRTFLRANAQREAQRRTGRGSKSIIREAGLVLKTNWISCLLCVGVATSVYSALHGSQDLYQLYLSKTKGFTNHHPTVAAMVGCCGAIVGGVTAGSLSQVIGRRLTMILFLLLGVAFIPLWILPSSLAGLCAGAFWVQFGVQGAAGVIPIWLAELSPPGFCALFSGFVAQIGIMLGSGAGLIERFLAGAKLFKKTTIVNGNSSVVPGYVTAMCIIFGLSTFFAIQMLFIASENHGSHFEAQNATFEEGDVNASGHSPPRVTLEEEKHSRLTVKRVDLSKDLEIGEKPFVSMRE